MQLLCLLLALIICSYGVKSSDEHDIKVLRRQWPRQKGTMVRILKRSTAIPAEFDPASYNAEEPELEEDHEQKWGLSDLDEADNFEPHEEEDLISGLQNPKRSGLFLRASRAAGSGLYLRTSRTPEVIPLSLRNGMLLRSFKRSLKRGGSGLFLRASKRPYALPEGKRASAPGLFLRSF